MPSKRQTKSQIAEYVRSELRDMAFEESLALLADIFGGCGAATASLQAYEAVKLARLCEHLARRTNTDKSLVRECVREIMAGCMD